MNNPQCVSIINTLLHKKVQSIKTGLSFVLRTSNVLLSQAATRQVPSTLEDFTSVFGMGTGVAIPNTEVKSSSVDGT